MDYTKGALDLDREAAVRFFMGRLPNHVAGPTGAFFDEEHLVELMQDGNFYALSNGEGEDGKDRSAQFCKDIIIPRVYALNKNDCENLANKAIGDMSDASTRLEWGANNLAVALAYDSKTLGNQEEEWGGYHVALSVAKWNPAKKDLEAWIVQPKVTFENGSELPEKWSRPEDEVRRWVNFLGR